MSYYRDVAEGEIEACQMVRLMAEREYRDLMERQYEDSFPFFFDEEKAERALTYYRMFPFVTGERADNDEVFCAGAVAIGLVFQRGGMAREGRA